MAYFPGVPINRSDATLSLIAANAFILVLLILILLIWRPPLWLLLLLLLILFIHIIVIFTMDTLKRRWIVNTLRRPFVRRRQTPHPADTTNHQLCLCYTNQDVSDRRMAVDPLLAAGFHNLSCSPST